MGTPSAGGPSYNHWTMSEKENLSVPKPVAGDMAHAVVKSGRDVLNLLPDAI